MGIPLVVRCECGESHSVDLGDAVDCPCGRRYDTSSLPPERFADVRVRQARIRLYLQLGLIFVLGITVLAAVVWGLKGLAVALPLAALMWFLFLGKWYRKRWLMRKAEQPTLTLDSSREP